MHNYIFNYYDGYEQGNDLVLRSEKEYTDEELNDLIASLLPDLFEACKENNIESTKLYSEKFPENAHELRPDEYYYNMMPSNLFDSIVDKLIKDHGFSYNEYKARFFMSGMFWDDCKSSCNINGKMIDSGFTLIQDEEYRNIQRWIKNEDITN